MGGGRGGTPKSRNSFLQYLNSGDGCPRPNKNIVTKQFKLKNKTHKKPYIKKILIFQHSMTLLISEAFFHNFP